MTPRHWTPALVALGLAALSHPVGAQDSPGKGSLGATVGVPFVLADDDLSEGIRPRLMMMLHFQYVISPVWRFSLRGGFGWTGYSGEVPAPYPYPSSGGGVDSTKVDQLTYIYPIYASLGRVHQLHENWKVMGGLGLGMYNIKIDNDRDPIRDPVTFEIYDLWAPGLSLEAGGEYSLPANRNVGFEANVTFHQLLTSSPERYPSGFGGKHAYLDLNFGVNVYFSLPGSEPAVKPALGEDGEPAETTAPAEPDTTQPPQTPGTP